MTGRSAIPWIILSSVLILSVTAKAINATGVLLSRPTGPPVQESPARLFAAHVLALRAAGVAGTESATTVLAAVPGATSEGEIESLPALWSPFFTNAVVKLGRLRSPAPVALYYNPLLDVALITTWEKHEGGYHVTAARALPGERLLTRNAGAPLRPKWTAATDGPIAALRHVTATRLAAFRHAHPAEAAQVGPDATTFAVAAADMQAALPRLIWNVAMRVQWAGKQAAWLEPALQRMDAALATHDAATIRTAAPETDATTAENLARLPAAFTTGLTLDMTVEAGGNDRLVVASAPGDGHVYAFALCRLNDGNCALQRFLLTSLEE